MYGARSGLPGYVTMPNMFSYESSRKVPLASHVVGRKANGPLRTTKSSSARVRTGPKYSSAKTVEFCHSRPASSRKSQYGCEMLGSTVRSSCSR